MSIINRQKQRDNMRTTPLLLLSTLLAPLFIVGCQEHDPSLNTPTSGHLILFVEAEYAPLIRPLVDSFQLRTPSTSIELREIEARAGVQEFLNAFITDTTRSDTSASVALIIGRRLLDDEREAIVSRGLEPRLHELTIGYDGIAVAVAESSSLKETTVARLTEALATKSRPESTLQEGAGSTPIRFLFGPANSSSYAFVRDNLLGDLESPEGGARWIGDRDSLLDMVAAGEGVAIGGWYSLSDSSRGIRTLALGGIDTNGVESRPVPVHISSLVMNLYPLETPIVGYALGNRNSLGNGFLSWIALSGDPQQYIANRGVEPENVRFRFEREE